MKLTEKQIIQLQKDDALTKMIYLAYKNISKK